MLATDGVLMSQFNLPDLGEGLTDARVVSWHVEPAQSINAGELLVSVETAKAIVDIPSPYAGRVTKLEAQVDEVVEVGQALLSIEKLPAHASDQSSPVAADPDENITTDCNDELVSDDAPCTPEHRTSLGIVGTIEHTIESGQPEQINNIERSISQNHRKSPASIEESQHPARQSSTIRAMPAVRVKANELGVNLADLAGTGPEQSITMHDLLASLPKTGTGLISPNSPIKQTKRTDAGLQKPTPTQQIVRKRMAEVMQASGAEIVPATVSELADIGEQPANCDLTVLAMEAIVHAAFTEPALNAWFDATEKVLNTQREVNLAIAVDTSIGLLAPVIRNAEQLNNHGLHQSLTDLITRARAGDVKPNDMTGATITLSNFGSIGGMYASLVIPLPMVAIVGIGKARDQVVAKDNSIMVRPLLPVSLTFDHRAVTGGEAARFLNALIDYLQDPSIDHRGQHI